MKSTCWQNLNEEKAALRGAVDKLSAPLPAVQPKSNKSRLYKGGFFIGIYAEGLGR